MRMNKTITIIFLLTVSVFITGCQTVYQGVPFVVEFSDTNSSIDNYKECLRLAERWCDNAPRCVGFTVDEIICEDGVCIC